MTTRKKKKTSDADEDQSLETSLELAPITSKMESLKITTLSDVRADELYYVIMTSLLQSRWYYYSIIYMDLNNIFFKKNIPVDI